MTISFYHMCAAAEWEAAKRQGEYRAESLATEGFIHASTQEQVVATANRYYRGLRDLVLLGIERDRVRAEIRWEKAAHGGLFPHLYGSLNLDAVEQVIPFPCGEDGGFSVPELPKARLSTARLVLREYEQEVWHTTFTYSSDIEVMCFVTYKTDTPQEAQAFVRDAIVKAQKQPRQEYQWAVTLQSERMLIGGCGLWLTESPEEAEMGYCLAQPHWGHGYATEAVRALLGFGFETLGVHRILARCNAENRASAHVMQKCGMRQEGRFQERIWGLGRWWDELEYAVLRREWTSH